MDKFIEIALKPVDRAVDWLIDSVLKEADYACNCEKYVADLRVAVHKLTEGRKRIFRLKEDADKRGETIPPTVDEWLKNTKQCIENAEEFLTLEDSPKMKCCVVMCPNCKTRHQRGRKAKAEIMDEVNYYIAESEKFPEISYREAPPSLRPVKEYESFESRASICKNIMEAMPDPVVNKIGLYGINGVGKTTLATEIAKQALEEKLFDEVAMATVFKYDNMKEMQGGMVVLNAQDIRRIQGEIAEGLGFQFQSETEFGRERELRERLKDGKKKLLVLDDIWGKFDLKDLGMDDLGGCKILMTSINQPVLSQMGSENNFMLDKLQDNEARDWFNRMVGEVFENPDIGTVAKRVADLCGGLPILLNTVAKGLKDKDEVNTLKDALNQLSGFDQKKMHADVNLALQLSYNLLGDDELQSLFRLCGQLNDPIYLDYMFMYAFGLGLLTKNNTMKGSRSQLLTFVKKLKDSCLLSEGNNSRVFVMHETVRNFAVSVASRDSVLTAARRTSLSDWPEENVLRKLRSVILRYCTIPTLPQVFECPELELFVLSSNDPSLQIPDNFFKGMRKLKVLDLTKIHFSQLPPSLQILKDLRTLCLDWCVLKNIKVIGELKRLQVLSFSGSDINELPKELQHLSDLKLLDLSCCKSLALIEVRLIEVLSSLGKLEVLMMEDTILQSRGISASLAKLKRLSKLHIHIADVKMLPKGNIWEGLESYRIFIGEGWNWSGEYRTPTTLKIKLNTSIQWDTGLQRLLKNTEDLYLDELKGITGSVYQLDASGFRGLKHLHVENSSDIQFIVNSTRLCDAFTSLESLFLDNLQKLKKICDGPISPVSFSKLRVLDLGRCGALESVFSSSMVGGLLRLEEIKIADCKSLKEIITEDSTDDVINDKAIELPQLRKLVLHSLPLFLRFFSNGNAPSPSMSQITRNITESSTRSEEIVHEIENNTPIPLFSERIHIRNLKELKLASISIDKIWDDLILEKPSCIQNLTSFTIFGCDKLKYLFSSVMLGSLVNLKTLQVSNCRMIEQIIITEGVGENKVTFSPLDNLELENLPELTQVCRSNLFECPGLKELSIINCPKLRKFVSNSRGKNVAVSNEAETTSFSLFDEKVAFSNLEGLTITKMNGIKLIWHDEFMVDSFSKLKRLSISNAEDLVKLFPSNYNYMLSKFKNVETLIIEDCNSLEDIFGFEAMRNATCLKGKVVSKLKMLDIKNLENLKHIWNQDATEFLSFPNLEAVNVKSCWNLKSIFPVSVAGVLSQLRRVDIADCAVEEIVSKEEGKQLTAYFYFPELTHLGLWRLPHLKSFYSGKHMTEFPKLKCLRVYGCDEMEIFSSESHINQEQCFEDQTDDSSRQPLFSCEKIPDLEEIPLKSNDVKILLDGHFPVELGNLKILQLQCDQSTTFPFDLIERFHNLKRLFVVNSGFKEIFGSDGFTESENHGKNLEKIQLLRLDFLYNLEHIKLEKALNNLRELQVWSCYRLTNFAPPSASLQNLKVLDVYDCTALVSLMASTTAESLGQLTKMSVRKCRMLRDIITNEGDERNGQITFHKLESLRFDCLTSLTSFSSTDWSFRFPLLKVVILKTCPNMRVFSQGELYAPKLRTVKTEGTDEIPWMGSLNATVQHLYEKLAGFEGLEYLDLSEFPQLEGKWPDQLPVSLFDKLKSLIVNAFTIRSSAIPANILPYLNVLDDLDVGNCNSIEEVFGIGKSNCPESSKHSSALTKLRLFNLPNLKHVWSEITYGMLDFRKLKQIKIHNCGSLRCIFTPPMLLGLGQLQEIEVKSCTVVREIVAKGAEHDALIDIRFHKLNSITLEGLPNLKCFYSGRGIVDFPCLSMVVVADCPKAFTSNFLGVQEQSTSTESTEVKISIPNLKELKLNINNIWNDQFLKVSSCIKALISLTVDGCDNLEHLLSSFMVEGLVNLKTLKVINCRMMQQIIITEEFGEGMIKLTFRKLEFLQLENLPNLTEVCTSDLFECPALKKLMIMNCSELKVFVSKSGKEIEAVDDEDEERNFYLFDKKVVFPNLEALKITRMNRINMIWRNELHDSSFFKLKQLYILDVLLLENVFPSNYVVSRLQNVETLIIEDCNSLEEIYSCEEITNTTHLSVAAKLKSLNMKKLENLKRIWNDGAAEAHTFQNLHEVILKECPNLKIAFPASVATKGFPQLTCVRINNCCSLEEVVSKEEGKEFFADFGLPELKDLELHGLPKLRSFYPGSHTSKFPKLKHVSVYLCSQIEIFCSESQHFEGQVCEDQIEISFQPILSAEEVIPAVEQLSLNSNDAAILLNGSFPASPLGNVKALYLQCFEDESRNFPFGLIQRFNNLEELRIRSCCFEDIFAHDGFVNENLRELMLNNLYNLKHIKFDRVIKKLETLKLRGCNKLTILAPSTASFRNLKVLVVLECNGLIKLMTSSTAESMVQLTRLHVQNCKGLTEIIETEGCEGRADITFHKLQTLRLDRLISLTNFCSSVCTLGFRVLEKLILKQCPKMTKFSRGNLHTPNLWEVQTEGRDKIPWMGDLNATVHQLYMQQAGFYGLKQMKLSEFPELKGRWSDQLPVQIFDLLISLVVDELTFCSRAVPWSRLRSLNLLEELEVRNCKSVDEVFDIEHPDTTVSAKYLSRLTKFQLVDLPKLKHAWNVNGRGMLDFSKLKHLHIQNCDSLTYIFTVSMLQCACALKQIEVKSCHKIKEIIAKDEIQDTEMDTITIWQRINSITLEDLPGLTCFYSRSVTVEFLALETLVVVDCPETFTSKFFRAEEGINDEATFVFPCLKKLRVAWDDVLKKIIQADLFCGLKDLELIHSPDDHALFPYHILQRLPNLENLALGDAALEEIAFCEETDGDDDHLRIATQIKELKLYKFPKLTLLSKDSQSKLILQNLESLIVSECANLKLLVPFSVSFDCLTILEVSKCPGLTNLIILSTAKSLVQLTELRVSECQTMIEVIAEDSNIAGSDIIFCKLKCLTLQSMQTLTRFYSGKYALKFPQLEEVYLNECPKIEAFSQGDVMMPKLKKLQLSGGENKENWESSHYAHLRQLFINMREAVVQTRTSSTSRQQSKDLKTTHAEKVSVDTKISSSTKNLTLQSETINKFARDDETTNSSLMEAEIIDVVSDSSSAILNKKKINKIFSKKIFSFKRTEPKDVSAKRESTQKIANEKEILAAFSREAEIIPSTSNNKDKVLSLTGISALQNGASGVSHSLTSEKDELMKKFSQNLNNPAILNDGNRISEKDSQAIDDVQVTLASSTHKSFTSFESQYSTVEQIRQPSYVSPKEMTSSSEFVSEENFRSISDTPSLSNVDRTRCSLVNFESLFSKAEGLLNPGPQSLPGSSSSVPDGEFQTSTEETSETYDLSLDQFKKILKNSLTEVATSADVFLLRSSLKTLKNHPHLSSDQLDIIQNYVENFDSLVTYHPFYEQQIITTRAIKSSIEDDRNGITYLKTLFGEFTSNESELKAEKKALEERLQALKERLHKIEEEEGYIRANMDALYANLVTKTEQLETNTNALPEAVRQQVVAEDRVSKGNQSWDKLRSLFA